MSSGFPTRSDTNQTVQPQKIVRILKIWIREKRECTIEVAKTKALIGFAVTANLICVFAFAYAKCVIILLNNIYDCQISI